MEKKAFLDSIKYMNAEILEYISSYHLTKKSFIDFINVKGTLAHRKYF